MKITLRQINNAIANGYNVTVVINGESYELEKVEDFNDGVKFAAAILEDKRARMNSCFEGLQMLHPNKTTLKAIRENQARNDEIKQATKFLHDVITGAAFSAWYGDYKRGELWKLK